MPSARVLARRAKFGEKFPFPLCDRLDTILEDGSVDAVAVLTPPNTHLDIVKRCAVAGKHVLLEKPLEITMARSEELVADCRGGGVTLGVVLQHRHKPAVARLARALRAGELGMLVGASASIRLWRPQSYYDEPGRGTRARDGGGVLVTQAIHTLDVLLSLAGDPREVKSYAATAPVHRMECEDLVCAAVHWQNGALGVIEATTAAYPGAAERIELTGTRRHGESRRHSIGVALARREEGNARCRWLRRWRRRRSDGVSARLSPQRVAGFSRRRSERRRTARQRRGGAARAPADRRPAGERQHGQNGALHCRGHGNWIGLR